MKRKLTKIMFVVFLLVICNFFAYASDEIPADTKYFQLVIERNSEYSNRSYFMKIVWNGNSGYIYKYYTIYLFTYADSVNGIQVERGIFPIKMVYLDRKIFNQITNKINQLRIYSLSGFYPKNPTYYPVNHTYTLSYKVKEKIEKREFVLVLNKNAKIDKSTKNLIYINKYFENMLNSFSESNSSILYEENPQ